MNPFYFGAKEKQLFGIYHPPAILNGRNAGVLLCYPLAQEYMRTHWSFRRLADQLASNGYHVLRFDYFGTGDSAGDTGEGDVDQWTSDIQVAWEELRDISGVKKISIVGLRLGGALAAITKGVELRNLVLWDPVIKGCDYLNSLEIMHKTMLEEHNNYRVDSLYETPDEILGFRYSQEMRRSIENINLFSGFQNTAQAITVVTSQKNDVYDLLENQLRDNGLNVGHLHVPDISGWDDVGKLEDAFLPKKILEKIVLLFSEKIS